MWGGGVVSGTAFDLGGRTHGSDGTHQRVIFILILVEDVRVGELLDKACSDANVTFWGVERSLRRCADDFSAEGLEHVDFLLRHLLGKRDDHAVTFERRREREANARVTARGLDERVARLDTTRRLSLLNHPQTNAVLHRAARAEELALRDDLAQEPLHNADAVQPNARRVPNAIEHRRKYTRAGCAGRQRVRTLGALRGRHPRVPRATRRAVSGRATRAVRLEGARRRTRYNWA